MQSISRQFRIQLSGLLMLCLLLGSPLVWALKSDREQQLEVYAESTDGTMGDGITSFDGKVDIRQGTLHITADKAEINKVDGAVKTVVFTGQPVALEQEIEEKGLVRATANRMEYQVASGLVTLTGKADVQHPQYQINGDKLVYDLNIQHFQGSSDEGSEGRIYIRLDPEVLNSGKQEDD